MMSKTKDNTGYKRYISQRYLASLPERTARAGAALMGGLVYEASEVLLPLAVRRSRLYQAIVGRLLRITIELVGGVEGVYPTEEMRVRELLVRKTAGNAIELSSFLAVGWSPVWLLAGASDLIGGTKVYLRVLATELRDTGVLSAEEDVASFEELLSALEGTSGVLADTVDVPPLNVSSVRTSWQELRRQVADLPDADGLEKIFSDPALRRALRITPPDEAPLESVVAVVVSNNPYEFARWGKFGQRHRLDTGTLQISVLDASTLEELERLLAGTMVGAIEFRPALRHWTSERLETGLLGEVVRAGVDGEPITLEAPLRFSVAPGALRVLVPEGSPTSRQMPPLEAGWHAARTLCRWLGPNIRIFVARGIGHGSICPVESTRTRSLHSTRAVCNT